MNKTNLKIIPNIPLDTLSISDIIERDASEKLVRNIPKFQDVTEPKHKKGNLWTKGVAYMVNIKRVL